MTRYLPVHLLMIVALMWTVGLEAARAKEAETAAPSVVKPLPDETPIAEVGGKVITGAELRKRYIREVGPSRDALYPEDRAVTLEHVADLLVREKAMAIEARAQGMLDNPDISWSLEKTVRSLLINHFVEKVMRPGAEVTEAQIEAVLKKHGKITREQATRAAQNDVIRANIQKLITGLTKRMNVKKDKANLVMAAGLYERMLRRPQVERSKNMPWVLKEQMLKELTAEQAGLKLAEFDGGAFTLIDFMKVIHGMVPVKRPKDLVTPRGVEKVVDGSLGAALIETHIRSLGLHKDPKIAHEITVREDQRLLSIITSKKAKSVVQPTDEEMKARFDQIKGRLKPDNQIKLQTIWCKDREAAAKANLALGRGRAFEDVFEQFNQGTQKSTPMSTMASSETIFWSQLWAAEPNQVVGPIQGFHRGEVKWRVVKVVEKKEGPAPTFQAWGPDRLHGHLYRERKEAVLKPFQDEVLKKYDPKVFTCRLQAFCPIAQ